MTDVDTNNENLTEKKQTVDNTSIVHSNIDVEQNTVDNANKSKEEPTGKSTASEVRTSGGNLLSGTTEIRVVEKLSMKENDKPNIVCENNTSEGISESCNESKYQQEEDIPESFFDDLMSEDFIEGLNVVDTWEGDDTPKQDIVETNLINKTYISDESIEQLATDKTKAAPLESNNREKKKYKDKIRNSDRKEKKSNASKNSNDLSRGDLRNKLRKRQLSKSRESRSGEISSRRDPNKTQRDILKDKDKCEKDKTTKLIYEKLKVVETGLVPPGTEMEVEVQNVNKNTSSNKLEEGEILSEQEIVSERKCPSKSKSIDHHKDSKQVKAESKRRSGSKSKEKRIRIRHSPEFRRIRSRSRSITKRFRSRDRSLERRIERRRRSRTRSRSLERRYRYRSPPRKSSPLLKRNENLYKEIDMLRARLYESQKSPPKPRNIQLELTETLRTTEVKHLHMETPQNFNNPMHFPQQSPLPNANFMPLQPVPPPQQHNMELDQQFFIGQPTFDPNPYGMPIQQPPPQSHPPPLMHNPVMGPPEIQPNFTQNWPPTNEPQLTQNFFNPPQNMGGNVCQMPPPHVGFPGNQINMNIIPNEHQFIPQPNHGPILHPAPPFINKENEEEVFAKLFADNKITLSDYLSVTAKTTDNSNPIDIQNKIKVISHCQDALSEINGSAKTTGKFLLRKSQKPPIKTPSTEGLSPFKKVPVIKFQFTTFTKGEDKITLGSSLNKLLFKVGMDTQFEEILPTQSPNTKNDQKESQTKVVQEKEKKITLNITTQTDTVSMVDFGCQVSFEDFPSPTKTILKKQSLAKLTPAQLLAQEEKEASPPPAPKWNTPTDNQRNRWINADTFGDTDDRRSRAPGFPEAAAWGGPGRNQMNPPFGLYYDRSPDPMQRPYYGNRY